MFLKRSLLLSVEQERDLEKCVTMFDFKLDSNDLTIEHYVDFKEYRWRTPFTTYEEEKMHGNFVMSHPFLDILEKFNKTLNSKI